MRALRTAALVYLMFYFAGKALAEPAEFFFKQYDLKTFSIHRPKTEQDRAYHEWVEVQKQEEARKQGRFRMSPLGVSCGPWMGPIKSCFELRKPPSRRIVAVLAIYEPGGNYLNSGTAGYEYGPIPEMRDMSVSVADQLWGAPEKIEQIEGNVESRTYVLVSETDNDQKIPQKKFHVDVIYKFGKLDRYRIRSEGVEPDWYSVPYCVKLQDKPSQN